MTDEEQMNMVEILSEELGQKEVKIMAHEKEIEELRRERVLFVEQVFIYENILFNGWNRRYDFRHGHSGSDLQKFVAQVDENSIDFSMKMRCYDLCEEINEEFELCDLETLMEIIKQGEDSEEPYEKSIEMIEQDIYNSITSYDPDPSAMPDDIEDYLPGGEVEFFCVEDTGTNVKYWFLIEQ
tara:strand:- start:49 stop:597 length:549 start_codon:yes stop_codon:yes gene_type:complete